MKNKVDDDEDHEMTEDEEVIRKQIDVWKSKLVLKWIQTDDYWNMKSRYKSSFNQLKSMKTEIDHLHYLLEKSRVTIQNQFEIWWSSKSHKFKDHQK